MLSRPASRGREADLSLAPLGIFGAGTLVGESKRTRHRLRSRSMSGELRSLWRSTFERFDSILSH